MNSNYIPQYVRDYGNGLLSAWCLLGQPPLPDGGLRARYGYWEFHLADNPERLAVDCWATSVNDEFYGMTLVGYEPISFDLVDNHN